MVTPTSDEEFVAWAQTALGADFGDSARRVFNVNSGNALLAAQRHPFFIQLAEHITRIAHEFQNIHDVELLMSSPQVQLHQKSYASALNRAFRVNVVRNARFPDPPDDGWLMPDAIPDRIKDLIRGRIVCKYIDQPRMLAEALSEYAKEQGLSSKYYSQERDDGYYAYHFYVRVPTTWVDRDFNERAIDLSVELQLTTQLQEIMYSITHQFYEDRRATHVEDPNAWKWDYRAARFRAGYLSHTLHLLEAIILDLRDSAHPAAPPPITGLPDAD